MMGGEQMNRCYTVRMGIGLGNGNCISQMPCGRCTYDGICGYDRDISFPCESCNHRFVCLTNTPSSASKILHSRKRVSWLPL